MPKSSLGPTPKSITGGCLCGSVRYKITYPDDHDFDSSNYLCQCTQCRKQTGGLFLVSQQVPVSALEWTSGTETLKEYAASESGRRGFCGECGSVLFWRSVAGRTISPTIGSVDPLYLFGEGAGARFGGGEDVPAEGFGRVLCSGTYVEWCANEIKGVTDDIPLLFRGKRLQGNAED
ncbi:glutathione-dependent formaldehyde-activating GFA [Sodiomyces alkalinus F11]|uniref:Glutathione-dependent formaldehyde-activating GFA n=1 Tax=Sodiomyces alkalinus (strain CBS 110278 / VKM F-3762 / F11) TaxID=1314773 RepID=A0A3N2Q404_SODAK|nr:glutathione-dependent formaldehyde-activating GFA [Sodiomyces alkalinus F11]ROT41446.1 glutathione-dependent formaldehyde-activating GFA [Sodiomyces alkalinus F11]